MRLSTLVGLMAVTLGAQVCAAQLLNVPLQWKPTSELDLGTVQMTQTPIEFGVFTDSRDNRQAIGENQEDDKSKPVTTSDDVGAFVGQHVRELFQRAGLKVVDSGGGVVVRGEVTGFFARETSTYQSEVAVRITIVSRDGRTLWNGLASGDATRFGRSYKIENYYEVLSDAVVNTVSSMLQSTQFQAASLSGQQ